MPPKKIFLSVKNLSHAYHTKNGETQALHDINFDLFPGEFAAIVGPSGCGKSTLLDLVAGFIPVQTGSLVYPSSERPPAIGYMLQKDHLLEYRTIYKNIILGLEIQHQLTAKNIAYARSLMEQYDIADFADAHPHELSGGMRQRAALIRTLALKPDLLLLDEPFSALDYQTRLSVSDDIWQIIRREKKTALLVTHDISEAVSMADQVIVLTRRPARIRRVIPITFKLPERTPMASRDMPEFKQYFNLIWKELNSHE